MFRGPSQRGEPLGQTLPGGRLGRALGAAPWPSRGERPALSEPQQQEVVALVRETAPDELGLAGFRWTRDAVAELIARRYGLWLARTDRGRVSAWLGFSPRSRGAGPGAEPGRGAALAGGGVPRHLGLAKREGGVVGWLDEMGVGSDAAGGPLLGADRADPVIKGTGKRCRGPCSARSRAPSPIGG